MEQLDIYYLSICFIQVRCTAAPAVAAERMCWYLFDTVFVFGRSIHHNDMAKKKNQIWRKRSACVFARVYLRFVTILYHYRALSECTIV